MERGKQEEVFKIEEEKNSFFFPTILLLILQLCRNSSGFIFYNLFIFNKLDVGTFFAFMIA